MRAAAARGRGLLLWRQRRRRLARRWGLAAPHPLPQLGCNAAIRPSVRVPLSGGAAPMSLPYFGGASGAVAAQWRDREAAQPAAVLERPPPPPPPPSLSAARAVK
ncbi:hypothetical protein PLESTB_000850900 [Pleodorina starrii]|uniref:Uncharacterized protein n=1 Tax=Pleodorina starrii TaxID=330485 RepID=A0A9W6BM54_9CHLO|nr:hypothetical protein PLESTM_001442400 [Pleodorina starrii]GLC54320.1 hypothetical protein PLESTB_000850900 [Pleodorina starrii]GLC71971.1 hypothetical protein PLESTF_001190500 [Pleodorina starrii]